MYFNFLPSIKYDLKPISYPFSEADYVVAKNFFRRYKISDTAFSSSVYFKKYAIEDGVRLDQVAEGAYGNANYDWVIALTNNMINPLFDLPMSEADLRKHIESRYTNPYYDVHHYEIISDAKQEELFGKVLMPGGTWVDETFYDGKRTLVADTFPDINSFNRTVIYNKEYIFTDDEDSSVGKFDNGYVSDLYGVIFSQYGTGLGSGGFILNYPLRNGSRSTGYLRFTGENGERYVVFNPVNTLNMTKFSMYAKYGTDYNGGEDPDIITPESQNEELYLDYRTDPNDPWTRIDRIIAIGSLQDFTFNPAAPLDPGYGGPGRPAGVYENITVYNVNLVATNIRATVTVDSTGYIEDITITDRGYHNRQNTTLIIRNEDIGNGFYYDANGDEFYLQDIVLPDVSYFSGENGEQYGRYGTVPFIFSLDIPAGAKSETTEFRLHQPSSSNSISDHYGIQSLTYTYEYIEEVKPDFDILKIDDDNYIIDGVAWTRVNGAWYRIVEYGYQYYDNNLIKTVAGNVLSRPVTEFEYESTENEKKRELYILKPNYVNQLVEDFRKASLYKKSSDFISNKLKKTG